MTKNNNFIYMTSVRHNNEESQETRLAVMQNDITYIKGEVEDIKRLVIDGYITKAEFDPIKKIVYGMVALLLTGVVGAILALIFK
jgi:hypothetical protein